MTDFLKGPNNTFRLNHRYPSFGRPWTRVYADTLIDSWFVGDFSSANYHITVEFDTNQKETMQVLVVARPEHASFTVYGRTSIQDELISLSAYVTASKLYLTASSLNSAFDGSKVIFTATYAETISQLGKPTVVPSSGSISSGSAPLTASHTIGSIAVLSQNTITAAVESDTITFLNGNGITITTDSTTKAITFDANVNMFKNITVGSSTFSTSTGNDTITFEEGTGIAISASAANKSIQISSTGIFNNITVNGNITSTGNISGTLTTASQPNITTVGTLIALDVSGEISGSITNCTGLPLPSGVTGILSVEKGGTGATTLSGLLKGNGTNSIISATAGTDYLTPSVSSIFTAAQTFNSLITLTTHEIYQTVNQTSGTVTINFTNGNVVYLNQTANITSLILSGILVGKSFSFNIIRKNLIGSALSITWGSAFKWANGSPPSLTNTANAIDIITCITFDGGLTVYGISSGTNFS